MLREELENFGKKLRLKWFFRNDERQFNINPFKQKSKFNPAKNDAAIEFYLSRLEEEILSLDKKISYSNLTKGERNALYSLRDDTSIIIKEADKDQMLSFGTERTTQRKQKNNLMIGKFSKN